MSLPVKLGVHIGSSQIDGNGASHCGSIAGGKAGGGGVSLATLTGTQIEVCMLINFFTITACAQNSCGADDVSIAEKSKACALSYSCVNGVVYNVQRRGSINCDVLGAGLAGVKGLTGGGSYIVVGGHLSADGVLTCNGNSVNVVVDYCFHAESIGSDVSVLADTCLSICIKVCHGEGCTNAHALALVLVAGLVLDGQAVVCSGGGSIIP